MAYSQEHPDLGEAPAASQDLEKLRLLDERFTELYNKVRRLAARVRWSGSNPTLNPTALAHEAYLKLRSNPPDLVGSTYDEVIAMFANAMLQILRDAARRKNAKKRESRELPAPPNVPIDEALMLAEALDSLYRHSPLQARVAQCRYLLGMTVGEAAAALALSTRTVERLWQEAKTQLNNSLNSPAGTS